MTVRWTVSDRPSDRPPDRPFFHRLAFPGGGPPGPRRPPSRPPVPSAGPLPSPCARVFSSRPPIPPSGRRRCPRAPLRFPALPSLARWYLAGPGFASWAQTKKKQPPSSAPFAGDPTAALPRTVKNYFIAGCSGYFFGHCAASPVVPPAHSVLLFWLKRRLSPLGHSTLFSPSWARALRRHYGRPFSPCPRPALGREAVRCPARGVNRCAPGQLLAGRPGARGDRRCVCRCRRAQRGHDGVLSGGEPGGGARGAGKSAEPRAPS